MKKTTETTFWQAPRSIEKNLLGFSAAEHCNMAGHSINDALICGIMLSRENTQRKHLEMHLTVQLGTSHLRGLSLTCISSRPRRLQILLSVHFFLSWRTQTLQGLMYL